MEVRPDKIIIVSGRMDAGIRVIDLTDQAGTDVVRLAEFLKHG